MFEAINERIEFDKLYFNCVYYIYLICWMGYDFFAELAVKIS